MYKLEYVSSTETHVPGKRIIIKDKNDILAAPYEFANQFDAFDYIKEVLENDGQYKDYIHYPETYIKEIYDYLDEKNKKLIQENLVQKYRIHCMNKYFN